LRAVTLALTGAVCLPYRSADYEILRKRPKKDHGKTSSLRLLLGMGSGKEQKGDNSR
jgi:murein endopeptidase